MERLAANCVGVNRMNKLKPCPFCGREASIRRDLRTGHTSIQCDYCRAWWTPAEYLTRNEITEAWNGRVKNDGEGFD